MNREPRVSDVGAQDEPPPRPAWLLPVVVGVGGFALGLLVATTIGSTGPSETAPTLPPAQPAAVPATDAAARNDTTTVPPVEDDSSPTLEERVPGFEGTLYIGDPTSSLRGERGVPVIVWPSTAAEAAASDVFAVSGFLVDQSGFSVAYSAVTGEAGGVPDAVLMVVENGLDPNRPTQPIPVGLGVESLVWHASKPGLLAWVEAEGGNRWSLKTLDVSLPDRQSGTQIVQDLEEAALVRYWDDEIFVLQTMSSDGMVPRTRVLDGDGRVLGEADVWFWSRLPSGELIASEGDLGEAGALSVFATDVRLSDRQTPPGVLEGEVAVLMVPSPDGSRTAALVADALASDQPETWETKVFTGDDWLSPTTLATGSSYPMWSPDGRWLVRQHPIDSLEFIDVTTNERHTIDWQAGWFLIAVGR